MTTHMSWFSRVYSSGTDLERLSKNGSRLRPRRSGATDQASTGSSNTNVATSRTGSAHASAARLRTSTIWIRLFSLLSVSAILLNISLWIFLGIQTGQRDGWFRKDHEKRLGFAAAVCFGVMVVATPAVVSVLAKNSRLPDKLKSKPALVEDGYLMTDMVYSFPHCGQPERHSLLGASAHIYIHWRGPAIL